MAEQPLLAILVAVISAMGVLIAAIIAAAIGLFGHLWKRIADLEDAHVQLWQLREADALVKRAAGDHIDVLEDHIWKGKPPPPPSRPAGV